MSCHSPDSLLTGTQNASQMERLIQAVEMLQGANSWPSAASVTRCEGAFQDPSLCLSFYYLCESALLARGQSSYGADDAYLSMFPVRVQ
jgi:hypothetical protein